MYLRALYFFFCGGECKEHKCFKLSDNKLFGASFVVC